MAAAAAGLAAAAAAAAVDVALAICGEGMVAPLTQHRACLQLAAWQSLPLEEACVGSITNAARAETAGCRQAQANNNSTGSLRRPHPCRG